ncbi:MAG: FapA family protein [Pseudomonadota bacterium]|nr:FapA family protein [Pseudomonadota bacterium]
MFTLNNENQVVLTVSEQTPMPPSADFVFQALANSEFADCYVLTKEVKEAFRDPDFDKLIVAEKHDATLTVSVSEDKMAATALLTTAYGGELMSMEQAVEIIKQANITRGYKQVWLESLLGKQFEAMPGKELSGVIAKGQIPVAGKNGSLEKNVQTLADRVRQPKRREDGSVDMRDFGALASVKPGDTLMTHHFATLGKDGFNVLGETLKAKPGDEVKLIAGDGTELSGTDDKYLVATIAGVPVDDKYGMRVDDVFTIPNVDVKSGHIDFDGSVIITENIEPGMKVTAKGDITVFGSVESAELNATGSIEIKEGCLGHHKENDELSNKISCEGNLAISYAQYTYLSGNQVKIKSQASHCHIKAKNELMIGNPEKGDGKLIGGKVLDAKTMICGEVGTDKGAHTEIHLGHAAVLLKNRTDEIFEQVRLCNQQLEALESEFDKALSIEDADKQQNLLIEISDKQNLNEQLIELLPNKAAKLERAIHMLRDYCYLEVQKALHSNVELRIFNKVLKTARTYPPLTARIDKNKIELEFKTT